MFSKSRRKIILAIMGSLVLLFALTLSVILLASYREVRQQNMEMLERHVELYYLEGEAAETDTERPGDPPSDRSGEPPASPPGDRPSDAPGEPPADRPPDLPADRPPLDRRPDYQLSTFYSVAFGEDGAVLAVDTGEKNVYSEEELISVAREIRDAGKESGRNGSLTYIVSSRPDYTLVAMMDNTVSESGLSTLLHNVLIVGCAALVVMFFISLVLSRRIIQPLEESDRKQKQFVSDASHELKTPVAVIGTNAEMLAREIGRSEWLDNIQYENNRMGELVKQLLDLSRAENAETPMEAVDFSRVVTGEALAFETFAFEQGKTLRTGIEDGILLSGNKSQLTQLVSILLDNAVRHTTGTDIEATLKRHGHAAVLTVINEGPAIPPEKQEHLFDRFYRLDEAHSGEGQHYGLGLSIAKAVVRKHGGSITVSCPEGKVQFTVSLPVKKAG